MRPIPDAPAAEMRVASWPESRTDVQVTPLSDDRQMSPRFPGTVWFGAGQTVAPMICSALLGPLKPGEDYTPPAIQLVPPSQAIDQAPSRAVVHGAVSGSVAMVTVAPPSGVAKCPASVVKKTGSGE